MRDGGCYGHVDGPRFNTQTEIRMLLQRRGDRGLADRRPRDGPVRRGRAALRADRLRDRLRQRRQPDEPTPVEELIRLIAASTATFARTLAAAVPRVTTAPAPVGTHFSWD